MLHIVTGGSGSGKSEYAERMVTKNTSDCLIYLATMMVWDDEGRERVRRHRSMRAGNGFMTVEQYTGLSSLELTPVITPAHQTETGRVEKPSVLLECMSNLAANEFYSNESHAYHNIMEGIARLRLQCRELVIVTNEVFGGGSGYGDETMRYIGLLGKVNCRLGEMADTVTEVVYGLPVRLKG